MGFYEVITEVENRTARNSMNEILYKENKDLTKGNSFETIGCIQNVATCKKLKGSKVDFLDIEGKRHVILTNKEEKYFDELIGKRVFLSGVLYADERNTILYVLSCYSIEGREDSIISCDCMSEDEKRSFCKKIQEFSPSLKKDLADKCTQVNNHSVQNENEEIPVLYKSIEELEALYDVLKKIIPIEFRAEYENCRRMMQKNISNAEKRNCIKVISEILSIDWINQLFREIDVEKAITYIMKNHVGHVNKIEELKTELLAYNLTQKAPKSFNFVGRSCGCGSLAKVFAKAIGKKYTIIDLSGIRVKETDQFTGSSRIYENGKCGLLYEKIREVGPSGVLIIKNIDTYGPEILNLIAQLIEKRTYTDYFMEIPIDLTNLWVICTSSSVRNLPMSLRSSTHEMYFEKLSENERIEVINQIIAPKQCEECSIIFNKRIPDEVCKKMIYQLSFMDNKKLEMVIRDIVVKLVAEGEKYFPKLNMKNMSRYFPIEYNCEKVCTEYATDLAAIENKFFQCYDLYYDSIRDRVIELFEVIRYGEDGNEKSYAIRALRYLVNPIMGEVKPYIPGRVEAILNETHFGQELLANQIDEALLAESLSGNGKNMMVFGLYGGPGIGKTTSAEAIAKALGRNYVKINFGGAYDASIIKGKNKVVANAEPSILVQELARRTSTYSDVINFDEFDKGTPQSYEAFHEFLDSTANTFYDEYLQCDIPKNNLLVILTFNDISKIPKPIIDRMRLIYSSGYTMSEKKVIIKNYVIRKITDRMKLKNVTITEEAVNVLINEYAVSPGIRDCEKDIERILVHLVKAGNTLKGLHIDVNTVRSALGGKRTRGLNDKGNELAIAGQAMALAVSGNIGSCVAIQVVSNPYQKEDIKVTGLLEGSCLESVSVAISLAGRALKKELPKLHIHFLDPSCKKDGASAGLTIFMAVMSYLLDKPLEDCAFTGTVDLYGNVGIVRVEEKLIAAEREGIGRVFIPRENYEQLVEEHKLEKYQLRITPVKHVSEITRELYEFEIV